MTTWFESLKSTYETPEASIVAQTSRETKKLSREMISNFLDKLANLVWVGKKEKPLSTESNDSSDNVRETIPAVEKNEAIVVPMVSNRVLADMRSLASDPEHQNQAWVKNNNPTGITRPVSSALNAQREKEWIHATQWSPRPAREGWNYVAFATMSEGMKAYRLALKKWDMTITDRLMKRVWHTDKASNLEYANKILRAAWWIDGNKKFSQLTDWEIDKLLAAQLKQESGSLAKVLKQKWLTPWQVIQANNLPEQDVYRNVA